MIKKNYLFVISAPSGAGKTSLIRGMLDSDKNLSLSISHTTREKRPGEIDGKDYFFVNEEAFKVLLQKNYFIEHAKVFNNFYGTSEEEIQNQLQLGKDLILEIDWQGARNLRKKFNNIIFIFIAPPDLKTLRERLISRSQDQYEIIEKRMAKAKDELSHFNEYDYVILNDKFEKALLQLQEIINSVRMGLKYNQINFADKINKILESDK